jgi:hypothetical protein
MGRYTGGNSYDHWIRRDGGEYTIGWTVDFYYPSSRLRFPRGFKRWTDEAGAKRFARKWGLNMPKDREDG